MARKTPKYTFTKKAVEFMRQRNEKQADLWEAHNRSIRSDGNGVSFSRGPRRSGRGNWRSSSFRAEAMAARGSSCETCGYDGYTEVHHVIPVSVGGEDTLSNVRVLCEYCHAKEHGTKKRVYKDPGCRKFHFGN